MCQRKKVPLDDHFHDTCHQSKVHNRKSHNALGLMDMPSKLIANLSRMLASAFAD
jgi:hypothetical protein